MSNDLISRSALLEEINNFSMRITGSANAMAIAIMEETKKSIAKLIDEQSTAYDVDKVAERLEEMRLKREEQLRACVDNDMADYLRCKMSAIAEAIEIVKSGGIAEEKKAEWKEHFASRFGRIE